MKKNVYSWFGLYLDGKEPILRGDGRGESDFRDRCHKYVCSIDQKEHDAFFPDTRSRRNYGSCVDLDDWKCFLQDNYSMRRAPSNLLFFLFQVQNHIAEPKIGVLSELGTIPWPAFLMLAKRLLL